MPREITKQFSRLDRPNFDGFVNTCTGKSLSIKGEGNRNHPIGMPLKRTELFARPHIPNFDGLVPTTTGKLLSIRAFCCQISSPVSESSNNFVGFKPVSA
jgi:hypothetical protein